MEVMRRYRLGEVVSNDDHFAQEGFSCLLRD
jgi:predicted nucleic acid-binding protein